MSRTYLIKKLKEKFPELNKLELQIILDTFNESIESALKNNKNLELRHFGTFFLKKIKFIHGKCYKMPNNIKLIACYHPSPRNVNTGLISEEMMVNLFLKAKKMAKL